MMIKLAAASLAALVLSFALAQADPAPVGPAPAPLAAPATASSAPAAPPRPEPSHALTAEDAAAFFDGMIPYALARADIAGGVITVVKDGQILFAQGYGYSDVAGRAPVIPDQTLFRPGSVSKLVAWTAVMQLVQAGKIDLDRDVNDYLDFKIAEKFGQPVTMRTLMTHTAGFEDEMSKAFVKSADQLTPLRDFLIEHQPARIYPPGKVVAYSNYGASLAGYIVERLSGESFAAYCENHLFKPLGMDRSTFAQPLPERLANGMSNGYLSASDEKPYPFEFIEVAPAGALSATATDMARFMIAQLQDGAARGAAILDPATLQLMHSPQSTMAPGLNGFALGFYQENRNGLRIVGHAGDTEAFHSDLHLLLDQHVGLYMSFNSAGKDGEADKVRVAVLQAFLDRYFPYSPAEEPTVGDPKPDAARVAGWYQGSRRIDSALRLLYAGNQSEVEARPDGTIEIAALTDLNGTPKRWREVGPLTWREIGGQAHAKFVADADGNVLYWISDDFVPVEIFQRMRGIHQLIVLEILTGVFVATLALTIAVWFGGWAVRLRFGARLLLSPWMARLRLASRIGAAILLVLLAGWLGLVSVLTAGSDIATMLAALYGIGVLGVLGALTILVEAVLRVLRGPGGWAVRGGEVLLGLSALFALWAIYAYGLASFSFTY